MSDEITKAIPDTCGQVLCNILTALDCGINVVDEDVIDILRGLGFGKIDAGRFICDHLQRPSETKVNRARRRINPNKDEGGCK